MQHTAAIVDYGMSNALNIQRACNLFGIQGVITTDPSAIEAADAMILPGVGAFGCAMTNLRDLGLVRVIKEYIQSGRPFMGICLGMQLLADKSYEFGEHQGLGLIPGQVVPFKNEDVINSTRFKIPQVGWNRINIPQNNHGSKKWEGTLLEGTINGEFVYFLHSFYLAPEDSEIVLSLTRYCGIEFCSTIQKDNIFACQFHPEKSGEKGLALFRNLKQLILRQKGQERD